MLSCSVPGEITSETLSSHNVCSLHSHSRLRSTSLPSLVSHQVSGDWHRGLDDHHQVCRARVWPSLRPSCCAHGDAMGGIGDAGAAAAAPLPVTECTLTDHQSDPARSITIRFRGNVGWDDIKAEVEVSIGFASHSLLLLNTICCPWLLEFSIVVIVLVSRPRFVFPVVWCFRMRTRAHTIIISHPSLVLAEKHFVPSVLSSDA